MKSPSSESDNAQQKITFLTQQVTVAKARAYDLLLLENSCRAQREQEQKNIVAIERALVDARIKEQRSHGRRPQKGDNGPAV